MSHSRCFCLVPMLPRTLSTKEVLSSYAISGLAIQLAFTATMVAGILETLN